MKPKALLFALLFLTVQALAEERAAVVQVVSPTGRGSGVCVSRTGLVLTAKHCRPSHETRVLFGEMSYSVQVAYMPPGEEGVVVLRVRSNQEFPFLPVANEPPQIGERVCALGYPAGAWSRTEGQVTGILDTPWGRRIETSFRVLEGSSGGPLLSEEGLVVGIASSRSPFPDELRFQSIRDGRPYNPNFARPASQWLHTHDIQDALLTVGWQSGSGSARRRLYVFTEPVFCSPCKLFEKDRKLNVGGIGSLIRQFEYVEVRWNPLGWTRADAVRAFEVQFGERPIFPTFWVDGASKYLAGYSPVEGNRRLKEYLNQFVTAASNGLPDPADDAPQPDVDWSQVRIIVIVARQDVSAVRGAIRGKLLEMAVGPLQRRVAELTDGKASLLIVAERTSPGRFAAVSSAARVQPDRVYVLVLVARQELGLRGVIAGKIEQIVSDRLDKAPFDLIFERAHPADYAAVDAALTADESLDNSPAPADAGPSLVALDQKLQRIGEVIERASGLLDGQKHRPDDPPKLPTERLAIGGLSAWITERLKLIAKLRSVFHVLRGKD